MDGVEDVVEARETLGPELVQVAHQEPPQLFAAVPRPDVPHSACAPIAARAKTEFYSESEQMV